MAEVSVVIPTYNRAGHLRNAIESVISQTHPVKEIIVCDDGSTDDSEKVCNDFNDARIKWLPCGRSGRPAIPRNAGLKVSSGEWIAFLDDDDEWMPEKIQRQLRAVSGRFACCTNGLRSGGPNDGQRFFTQALPPVFGFNQLLEDNIVICSSMMIHRSLLAKIGGFPEKKELRALEDYALWLRVSSLTEIAYIDSPLIRYRDEASASIRKDGTSPYRQKILVLEDAERWLASEKPEDYSHYLGQVSHAKAAQRKRLFKQKVKSILGRS